MPNPLVDELSDDAKAELAAMFAEMRRNYPPVRFERISGFVRTVPLFMPKPWQKRGW